jgi:hypothetical protein
MDGYGCHRVSSCSISLCTLAFFFTGKSFAVTTTTTTTTTTSIHDDDDDCVGQYGQAKNKWQSNHDLLGLGFVFFVL